jgi:hypothetical protein
MTAVMQCSSSGFSRPQKILNAVDPECQPSSGLLCWLTENNWVEWSIDHDNHHACRKAWKNFNCTLYLPPWIVLWWMSAHLDICVYKSQELVMSLVSSWSHWQSASDCSSFVFRSVYRLGQQAVLCHLGQSYVRLLPHSRNPQSVYESCLNTTFTTFEPVPHIRASSPLTSQFPICELIPLELIFVLGASSRQ